MFPLTLLNPWVWLGALILLGGSCTTGYVAGRKHEANSWKAEQAEQLAASIKEREAYLANVAEMVKRYNEKKEKTRVVYRTIYEQVPGATTGAACLSQSGVSVWNSGLAGKNLLSSPTPGAADAPAGAGATDTQVLHNAVTNFEQYKSCRDQLNALIDHEEKIRGR